MFHSRPLPNLTLMLSPFTSTLYPTTSINAGSSRRARIRRRRLTGRCSRRGRQGIRHPQRGVSEQVQSRQQEAAGRADPRAPGQFEPGSAIIPSWVLTCFLVQNFFKSYTAPYKVPREVRRAVYSFRVFNIDAEALRLTLSFLCHLDRSSSSTTFLAQCPERFAGTFCEMPST